MKTLEEKREAQRLATARWRASHPETARAAWRRAEANRDVEARRARVNERTARLRAKVAEMKARPCADCGIQYPPYVMQFDHRDPADKLFNIGNGMAAHAWEAVQAEVAKCDVVCANCHAERSFGPKRGVA